jgi:sulfoxide reductase heme-binding subunit YedZ
MTTLPWLDRSGRLSLLKLVVFVGLFVPAVWLALEWFMGWLMPKPVTAAIHESGEWAVRFLVLSLLISPLRRSANWGRLILVRRMVGVAALAYAFLHVSLYVVDQKYDWLTVASEILHRFYLTIGFVALCGLIALGATSTDGMIRRLGSRTWQRLHNLVYAISVLALVHFVLQSKIDVTQAMLMIGLFLVLMAARLMTWAHWRVGPAALVGSAVACALATVLIEAAWYGLATGIPASRVLAANLDFDVTVRPAWWVLLGGLALAAIALLRGAGNAREARPAQGVQRRGKPAKASRSATVSPMSSN